MLSVAERHKYIIDTLNKQGFLRIADIANELGFTKVTIRKDIKTLEDNGILFKTHGSARLLNPQVSDTNVQIKDTINSETKHNIAIKACDLINDVDSIIIASGSTIYAFAEEIIKKHWANLNIVTPYVRLGMLFSEIDDISVFQLGGMIHKKSCSAYGEEALKALDDCICSKVFFGVDGIDIECGITTSTIEEAKLTRKMMKSASKNIILADSSKFGQHGFGRICALEDIDTIITDDKISKQMISLIEEIGINLIIVKS